jgi:transglutaminase-like putative cysteine protease
MEYITWNTDYEYYACTRRGAIKTWSDRQGNCCDMAHLMCALARSLGIPARYQHWLCQFSDSQEGHVWAGLYIPDAPSGTKGNDGNWFYADPVNNKCRLGYQSFKLIHTYSNDKLAELLI